ARDDRPPAERCHRRRRARGARRVPAGPVPRVDRRGLPGFAVAHPAGGQRVLGRARDGGGVRARRVLGAAPVGDALPAQHRSALRAPGGGRRRPRLPADDGAGGDGRRAGHQPPGPRGDRRRAGPGQGGGRPGGAGAVEPAPARVAAQPVDPRPADRAVQPALHGGDLRARAGSHAPRGPAAQRADARPGSLQAPQRQPRPRRRRPAPARARRAAVPQLPPRGHRLPGRRRGVRGGVAGRLGRGGRGARRVRARRDPREGRPLPGGLARRRPGVDRRGRGVRPRRVAGGAPARGGRGALPGQGHRPRPGGGGRLLAALGADRDRVRLTGAWRPGAISPWGPAPGVAGFRGVLLLLLLVVPFVEIYRLVVGGRWLGPWPVVGFLFASLVIGGALARREGRRIARGMAEARRAGEAPSEGMVGALLAAVAGALLAWPGPLTTAAGLALLVPPVRRLLGRAAGRWVER